MKRVAVFIVALLLVVIAAAGAGAYWLGKQAEGAYKAMFQSLSKNGQVTIANSTYDRGWLSSTADVTISVPGSPGGLSVTSHIQHGPFPGIMALKFMPGLAVVDSVLTGNSPALAKFSGIKAHTMIYLAGNSETDLDIPPYRQPPPGGLAWQGASGRVTVSADQQDVDGNITFPQVQLGGPAGTLTLNQAAVNWNRLPSPSGLGVGGYNISVANIALNNAGGPIAIEGTQIAASSRESAGSQTMTFSLAVRAIKEGIAGQKPDLIGPGQIAVQLSKLDTASLLSYQRDTQMLYNRKLPPDKLGPAALGAFTKLFISLARKSPELEITKLTVNVGGSQITGKGKFVLDGSNLASADSPMALIQAIQGEAGLFVPRAAVATLATQDIHRQLAAYKIQGALTPDEAKNLTPDKVSAITDEALPAYMNRVIAGMHLVPDDGDFRWSVAARQGQWLINDKPVSQPPAAKGGAQ